MVRRGMGAADEFHDWARRWIDLAEFPGPKLPDEEGRIAAVVELWRAPIPGQCQWRRGPDERLLDRHIRYCRGNSGPDDQRGPEEAIEYDILSPEAEDMKMCCLGARLVDGVNAVPLAKDLGGKRKGNVEADMVLLVRDEHKQEYRLLLVEVKVGANNAWYALVEHLRQLRLFLEAVEAKRLFHNRRPELDLPELLPVTGVVLAPESFFSAKGQKGASVKPAETLLSRMRDETSVDIRLATWDRDCIKQR